MEIGKNNTQKISSLKFDFFIKVKKYKNLIAALKKKKKERDAENTSALGILHNTKKVKGNNHLLSLGDYLVAAVRESSTYDQVINWKV